MIIKLSTLDSIYIKKNNEWFMTIKNEIYSNIFIGFSFYDMIFIPSFCEMKKSIKNTDIYFSWSFMKKIEFAGLPDEIKGYLLFS